MYVYGRTVQKVTTASSGLRSHCATLCLLMRGLTLLQATRRRRHLHRALAATMAAAVDGAPSATACPTTHFIDVGANLLDGMFSGTYHGSQRHAPDIEAVLTRAVSVGLRRVIVTGSDLAESRAALALARSINASKQFPALTLHSTVGVHPTHTSQLNEPTVKAEYVAALSDVIRDGVTDGTVVAVGETGLDYDRLHFASKETQLAHFELHFDLAETHRLPLFLHDRNTGGDFHGIVSRHMHRVPGGIVHSFTGSSAELESYLSLGLHVGVNGCSLKTEENLSVVRGIPLHRLHLETDAPWCEIRRTHASFPFVRTTFTAVAKEKHVPGAMVKGRCEPTSIVQVAEVLAHLHGTTVAAIASRACENSTRLFFSPRSE